MTGIDLANADAFYLEYGRTLAQWAAIEARLSFWFEYVTKMPPPMASRIFYSARSFSGRSEMLEAAISQAKLPDAELEFIKEAVSKSIQYNSFRNQLAHGEPVHLLTMGADRRPQLGEWALQQGRDRYSRTGPRINIKALGTAAANFGELATLLDQALPTRRLFGDEPSPEKCLERVRELPNRPDSATPSRKQLARLRQPLAARPKGSPK